MVVKERPCIWTWERMHEKTILEVNAMQNLFELPSGEVVFRDTELSAFTYEGTMISIAGIALTPHGRVQPDNWKRWHDNPGVYGSHYVVAKLFTNKVIEGFWVGGSLLYVKDYCSRCNAIMKNVAIFKDRNTARSISKTRGGIEW